MYILADIKWHFNKSKFVYKQRRLLKKKSKNDLVIYLLTDKVIYRGTPPLKTYICVHKDVSSLGAGNLCDKIIHILL